MPKTLINDEEWNQCFGCSPHNPNGLQLVFTQFEDGRFEARVEVPCHMTGPPGIVHGGIQAALVDEVMGMAAHADAEGSMAVTAELNLKYRRPVPLEKPLLVRGQLVRREEKNFFLSAEIIGPDEEVLTEAEARFKAVEGGPRFQSSELAD